MISESQIYFDVYLRKLFREYKTDTKICLFFCIFFISCGKSEIPMAKPIKPKYNPSVLFEYKEINKKRIKWKKEKFNKKFSSRVSR